MSNFWWVMALIIIFIFGQWTMLRPSPYEQRLLRLREAARKMSLNPKLVPPPEWLKTEHKQWIARYSIILADSKMAYFRAEKQADGQWKTVVGTDVLGNTELPADAANLLAVEGQANSVAFYWRETINQEVASPDNLPALKTWLETLADKQRLS